MRQSRHANGTRDDATIKHKMAVTQAYYKDENRDVGNEAVVAGVNASAGNEAEVTIDRLS